MAFCPFPAFLSAQTLGGLIKRYFEAWEYLLLRDVTLPSYHGWLNWRCVGHIQAW